MSEGVSLEGVHPECYVHPRAVGQEGGQGSLLEQSEDQDLVPVGEGGSSVRNQKGTRRIYQDFSEFVCLEKKEKRQLQISSHLKSQTPQKTSKR